MEQPLKIVDAPPRHEVRGHGLLRHVDRAFNALERRIDHWVPATVNPLGHTGAIANLAFAVAVVTGALLLFWYVPSVHGAWDSLDQMGFLGQFLRSMHRYSSDACMFFVLLHAVKLFVAERFSGPRWIAWITGIALLAMLWFVGWIGYWLVWDVRAQAVALESARIVEVLPIFTEPLGRTFLTDESVSTALFFTVFFFHMLLPLAMGIALWMHISRVARPRFFTSRPMTVWVMGALIACSVIFPATSAERAAMASALPAFDMDWWFLAPLVITQRLGAGAIWALGLFGAVAVASIPWTLTKKRAQTVAVDVKRCNGCSLCAADCPYDAIVMVPRADGNARYTLQAQVDPAKCVGCGICAGACNPGGIGLPDMPVQEQRRLVDGWVDEEIDRGEQAYIAFVCANSAGGEFFVQGDGTCRELPGYHVVGVPCSGWVHPLTVERALRRGASGIVIVGCGCTDPPFREGPKWTDERLGERREPGLRLEKIDPAKIRFLKLARGAEDELVERVRAFAEHREAPERAPSRAGAVGTGLVVALVFGLLTLVGSALPSLLRPDERPMLVVSLKHRPEDVQQCRPVSPDEKAKMPPHMRRDEICARQRPDVRVEVRVDDETVHVASYPPHGLSGDGPSFGTLELPLAPGPRRVEVLIGDTIHPDWTHRFDQTVDAQPSRRAVVLFDTRAGFSLAD